MTIKNYYLINLVYIFSSVVAIGVFTIDITDINLYLFSSTSSIHISRAFEPRISTLISEINDTRDYLKAHKQIISVLI